MNSHDSSGPDNVRAHDPAPAAALAALPIALAALALTLPMASGTIGRAAAASAETEDWPGFESTEVVPPSAGLDFSVRYPPGFARGRISRVKGLDGEGTPAGEGDAPSDMTLIQDFRSPPGNDPMETTAMSIILETLGDSEAIARRAGPEAYWKLRGERTAQEMDATFNGARRLSVGGMEAADLFFTSTIDESGPKRAYVVFFVQRVLLKGRLALQFSCLHSRRLAESLKAGHTSRDNPSMRSYCAHFLESLEFKR
jgi:hypothetical protein